MILELTLAESRKRNTQRQPSSKRGKSLLLAVLDGQRILCIGGLPPCFPPPLKHGLTPIPLDEVVECHTPQVATVYWASKDKGVT